MEQQPQQPQIVFPWPSMQQPQQDFLPAVVNQVPARVSMAADFALTMARRAGPIIAVGQFGTTEHQTAELTNHERAAWDAACALLVDYFGGAADLDEFEEVRLDAMLAETDRRRVGQIMPCGACNGAGKIKDKDTKKYAICRLCDGSRYVLVTPSKFASRADGASVIPEVGNE